MIESKDKIIENIKQIDCSDYLWHSLEEPFKSLKKAAVLIPLVINSSTGSLDVWLTKRSNLVSHDKGHVSFPGGMKDASDHNSYDTALREAKEEINLFRHEVEICGELLPFINDRLIFVTPVVGFVSEKFTPTPNCEVEFAFKIPLKRYLDSVGHSVIHYTKDFNDNILHSFDDIINNNSIVTYGLTAFISIELAFLIHKHKPNFIYTSDGKYMSDIPFNETLSALKKMKDNLLKSFQDNSE